MQRLRQKFDTLTSDLNTSSPCKKHVKKSFYKQTKNHLFQKNPDNQKTSHSPNKRLELRYSPKKNRTIFDYKKNITASVKLPVNKSVLNENAHDIDKLLEISQEQILEHAARRVDLFFYTLIAYYKSNLVPESGWTKLQHGKGRNAPDHTTITQACHSSFTPSLIDNTISKKIPLISDAHGNLTCKTSLICGTHFMDSLSSTLELPHFVNEFDSDLEEKYQCRKISLAIIATVAKGQLDPAEGLKIFFMMMQNTFAVMLKDKHFHQPPTLFELIKKGTFNNKWNEETGKYNQEYLFMLLRLKPDEIIACKANPKKMLRIFDNKYKIIKDEIISTPSEYTYAPNSPRKLSI